MNQKLNQGLSGILAIVIVLAIAIVAFGGAYYYKMGELSRAQSIEYQRQPLVPLKAVFFDNKLLGWQSYQNEQYGIELKYPPNWILSKNEGTSSDFMVAFIPPDFPLTQEGNSLVLAVLSTPTVRNEFNGISSTEEIMKRLNKDGSNGRAGIFGPAWGPSYETTVNGVAAIKITRADSLSKTVDILVLIPLNGEIVTIGILEATSTLLFNDFLSSVNFTGVENLAVKTNTPPAISSSTPDTKAGEKCEYRKGKYEMRVYDEQGQMTGMINGMIKEEIPNSIFDPESNGVVLFTPEGQYTYEMYCLEEGNYQFERASVVNGEQTVFNAENIPFYSGQTHRYQLDWDKLAKGSKGATILVDNDKDGIFEKTFSVGETLSCQDYLKQIKK